MTLRTVVALVVCALALLALPWIIGNEFYVNMATQVLIYALFALSINMMLGYGGMVSLGHAGYLGIAGYACILAVTAGYDDLTAAIFAVALSTAAAAFFGLLSLRAPGLGFIMITLALGQIVWGIAYRANDLTGGDNGIRYPARPMPFGFDIRDASSFYYFTLAVFVVALFCIRQAKAGGLSQLCSSPAVHNEMLRRRPELCAALYEPVWRSRFGEEDATDDSSYPLPVWGARGAKFTSHYSRTFIEVAQRRPEVPRLSEAQAEAIDLLHEIAEELSFEMSFRPGDIQFVNNHVIYHARRGFEDDAADGGRLLLRLWMAVPNSRALPDGHEILWRDIAAGALRGGIGQTQTTPVG